MMYKKTIVILILSLFAIGGSAEPLEKVVVNAKLDSVLSLYDNGEYQKSIDSLTALLPALQTMYDSLLALEYLAFSSFQLGQVYDSKVYFKKALDINPSIELDSLECPPGIAVIFWQVKQEHAILDIDSNTATQPTLRTTSKNSAMPILLITLALSSAGAGGYFFNSGVLHQREYHEINTPDQTRLDATYKAYRADYIKSALFFGASAVLLPVSLYLFLRTDHPQTDTQ